MVFVKGEGGDYVSSGIVRLGGERPNNTSGGHLCEGYTHGINMVIRTLGNCVMTSMTIVRETLMGVQHSYD